MTPVTIIGCGAVGYPLAAFLAAQGREVTAVRAGNAEAAVGMREITVRLGGEVLRAEVRSVRLSEVKRLEGIIVIAAKAFANPDLARRLEELPTNGPIVVFQNGLGVERAFLNRSWSGVLRGVLYMTSQPVSECEFSFHAVAPSPLGVMEGDPALLPSCVEAINTSQFPLRAEAEIQREVWKKAIINGVFNSICPLIESDNGIFARSGEAASLARELVRETMALTNALAISLNEDELMARILQISDGSPQWISTLQDIRQGRRTEMEFLNLEMARIASGLNPPVAVPLLAALGRLIELKAGLARGCF